MSLPDRRKLRLPMVLSCGSLWARLRGGNYTALRTDRKGLTKQCMNTLDNINPWKRGLLETLRKFGCLLLIIVATIASNTCKKGTAIEVPTRPTADSLREAETLYSQREDLL